MTTFVLVHGAWHGELLKWGTKSNVILGQC